MMTDLPNKKKVYLDTTILHYGEGLRGIPQVTLQLIRLLLNSNSIPGVCFIATKKVFRVFLQPLGVPEERVDIVSDVPFFPEDVHFVGLFCNMRYRKIKKRASFIIHPDFRSVLISTIPQAVIIHDLFWHSPFSWFKKRKLYMVPLALLYHHYILVKFKTALSVKYKISNSDYTKQAVLHKFSYLEPSSISTLHLGIRFGTSIIIRQIKHSDQNPIRFLFVGGLADPRKNIPALLENFETIAGNYNVHLDLVGVIDPPEKLSFLKEIIQKHSLETKVTIHGVVPDEKLVSFYKSAHFLLFPSLNEGFGLPIIEAMATGLVVCAFNNSTIKEIGGDAIIVSENNDFTSWGEKISFLISNPLEYNTLADKAIAHAGKFSESQMFNRYEQYFRKIILTNGII